MRTTYDAASPPTDPRQIRAARGGAWLSRRQSTPAHSQANCSALSVQVSDDLGPDRFRLAIEAQLSRRAGPAIIGRPHKPDKSGESSL